jgi:HEAT repeat protein
MKIRLFSAAVVVLGMMATFAAAQTTASPAPLAVFDETTLRQAGVGTEAAALLEHVRYYLRNEGDPVKIKALISQLAHPDFEQRSRAAKELIAAGRPALEPLRLAHKKHIEAEVRLRAGDCITILESKLDPNLMMPVVRRLCALRAEGAAERLLELLPVVDWDIQDEIFHGLPRVALRGGKLDPALLAALEEPSASRRAAAALAVALCGSGEDRTRVAKLLADSDASLRLRAAQGLLAVHEPASLPVLIALLNEPAVEISWSAEELLHWVAGENAPANKVGAASAEERQQAVDAWTAWHARYAARIDWKKLEEAPRRPGLYVACDQESVWLGGCDGRPRWTLAGQRAHDAILLPNNEWLIAPYRNKTELIKCDLTGKKLWDHRQGRSSDYAMCQLLPNGHLLAVSTLDVLEMTVAGEVVSVLELNPGATMVGDAWQLRSGPLLIRTTEGICAFDRISGQQLRATGLSEVKFDELHKFAVLPDGRCLLADRDGSRLLETDAGGQVRQVLPVCGPSSVEALRNGNYLITTDWNNRILELDPAGRTLWEVFPSSFVYRVRSVLDKVRIGFDHPWPGFNLDSVANRVHDLKDPSPKVRSRSARFLRHLRPTDDKSLLALAAALDDPDGEVRSAADYALAAIGEAAIPALVDTLKTGTRDGRYEAVETLMRIGSPAKDAVSELSELVRDGKLDLEIRQRGVEALGSIGPAAKAAVPMLLELLKGNSDPLRYYAALNIIEVAPKDPQVVAGLIQALREPNYPKGQEAALVALSRIGPAAKPALPVLIETVSASAAAVPLRCDAAETITRLKKDAAPVVPVLIKLLKDAQQPLELRIRIAYTLGFLHETGKPALPVFCELLREPLHDGLGSALLKGLAGFGEDSVPELVRVVKDGKPNLRMVAIGELKELGNAANAALPTLEKVQNQDEDPHMRTLAWQAIIMIKHRDRENEPSLD